MLYVDQELDSIHRIRYVGNPANQAPTAVAAADKVSGPAPLTVRLDGTKSTDPDARDAFSYAWDLDGDGQFDDSNNAKPKLTLPASRHGHRGRAGSPTPAGCPAPTRWASRSPSRPRR